MVRCYDSEKEYGGFALSPEFTVSHTADVLGTVGESVGCCYDFSGIVMCWNPQAIHPSIRNVHKLYLKIQMCIKILSYPWEFSQAFMCVVGVSEGRETPNYQEPWAGFESGHSQPASDLGEETFPGFLLLFAHKSQVYPWGWPGINRYLRTWVPVPHTRALGCPLPLWACPTKPAFEATDVDGSCLRAVLISGIDFAQGASWCWLSHLFWLATSLFSVSFECRGK